MFLPARFVVVDDRQEHLQAIVESLQASGTPCHAIRYDATQDIDPLLFKGLRALFMDLQLQSNLPSVDYKSHFAIIQGILEDCISADAGPFLMMLWTDQSEKSLDLEAYLTTNLGGDKAHCRPLAIIPLNKSAFITQAGDLKDGATTREELRSAIQIKVNQVPSLAAMMQWEAEISLAAAEVLSDLVNVASSVALAGEPDADTVGRNVGTMATALKLLAKAASGDSQDSSLVRLSLHDALLPMLNDHIYNLDINADAAGTWSRTFEHATDPLPKLPIETTGKLNKRIHFQISSEPADPGAASAWGAVSAVPVDFDWGRLGLTDSSDLERQTTNSLRKKPTEDGVFVNIRIGAACDYAQNKPGPITFVVACLFRCPATGPLENVSKANNWISPVFELDGRPSQLVINPRMVHTTGYVEAESYEFKFRMREQLVMELISRIGFHSSRPGIIRFD